jgi:hypothetical protein
MHLDPPEHIDPSYAVEALYRANNGDAVRFSLTVDESDPDVSARRHAIQFVSLEDPDEPLAEVTHSLKRVEASQGRFFWTESQFHVCGPEVPSGKLPEAEVEEEVKAYVDRIRALDRARILVEV